MSKEQEKYKNITIEKAGGKLGVLLPGLGAVSTTFIAGVMAIRRGLARPIGSLTQMNHIRLGRRDEHRNPLIKELVPLSELDDLYFTAWDIFEDNAYEAAVKAGVLENAHLQPLKEELEQVKSMPAVFSKDYVKKLDGSYVKKAPDKYEYMQLLREDIRNFKETYSLERLVMIWTGSTEIFIKPSAVHQTKAAFEQAMKDNHPDVAPSMLYAWAAIAEGVPYANGSPNLSADIPAMYEFAEEMNVPLAGKDFKTGQTLMKTILAPGFKARMLGIEGWFSTNILGNRDGEVLDDPGSFKTKEESKLSVLEQILQPDLYPELYEDLYHKVRINYYPPRRDNKEGWDNIDIFGWMNYPMQVKVDFLCRDSILAAPIVLDLVLFMDLAARAGFKGIQEWLSFYFKSPIHAPNLYPEHDLFIQLMKLKNTLRIMVGEKEITHLGLDYYI
ncbi:MAG TPA: inositol-3-phosphate synthase [Calditrichaeota bacterium]|nr:inositol-3-phosphate synthase [Calditrichota bacterium]